MFDKSYSILDVLVDLSLNEVRRLQVVVIIIIISLVFHSIFQKASLAKALKMHQIK